MNCRGTAPPTTLSTNSIPPRGPRARSPAGRRRTGRAHRTASPAGPAPLSAGGRSRAGRSAPAPPPPDPAHLERRDQLVDVRRTHGPEHQLVGLRVVLQPHRDVLGHQPLQRESQLLLVALDVAWIATAAAARAATRARPEPACRCGQRVRGLGRGSLDTRTRSPAILAVFGRVSSPTRSRPAGRCARRQCRGRRARLTRWRSAAGGPETCIGSSGLRFRRRPDEGQPADERVGRGAHHLGDQWSGRVAGDLPRIRPGRGSSPPA